MQEIAYIHVVAQDGMGNIELEKFDQNKPNEFFLEVIEGLIILTDNITHNSVQVNYVIYVGNFKSRTEIFHPNIVISIIGEFVK